MTGKQFDESRHPRANGDGKFTERSADDPGNNVLSAGRGTTVVGDGHPRPLTVLPGVPDEWFTDENAQAVERIADATAGLEGTLTVFSYNDAALGEWRAAMPLPSGHHLVFTKYRGSVLAVNTSMHPTDNMFTLAHGVEDRDGDLPAVVEQVVEMDQTLGRFRSEFPYIHSGMGRRVGRPPQINLSDLGRDEMVVLQRDEHGAWRPEGGPAAWARIAPAAGGWADAEQFLGHLNNDQ